MKYNIFLIVAVFAAFFSCKEVKYEDYSLELDQYRQMGIPDPGKVWNFDEIQTAYYSLSGIKWDKPYTLPRKDSKKSGVLFDRMITLENMTFLQNDTLKLHEKGYMSLDFLKLTENWNDLYTNPVWKNQYYQRELVDININEVRITEIMVDLTKKILVSEDPIDIMMQEGIPKVKENYVSSLINALNSQKETSEVLQKDIERMTDSLSSSITRNREWLDSASTNKIRNSIHTIVDNTSLDYVKEQYQTIFEILSN